MAEGTKKKIFLWTTPRSCSTAFARAMAARHDTKVILEPYVSCYYYSSEKQSDRYEENSHEGYTFKECKELCEEEPSEKYVFIKDMAYQLGGRYDAIPDGFQHTFLIRNPNKTVRSLHGIITKGEDPDWTSFNKTEVGFKQLMELFKHITKVLGHEPIVIEADDLINNSVGILKKYCQKVGMDYKDSMVEWDESAKSFQKLHNKQWHPWRKNLITTKKFEDTLKGKEQEMNLPEIYQEAIRESMDVYHELYNYKLELD